MSLSEQIILITGASAGIGAALAQNLAIQYPGVGLILAARSQDKLEQVAINCRQAGAKVLVVPTDMAETSQIQHLVDIALQEFGQVDILVNNAGYGQMGPIELVPVGAAREQFNVNFYGALFLIQLLIPVMRSRGGGRIINISSIAGRTAFPMGGIYSASKFALEAISDALRMELGAFNIHVSVVEPGPVITDFFGVARHKSEKHIDNLENTPYRAALDSLNSIEDQVKLLGWSADRVATVIIKVMLARKPRPRYLAATGGNILICLMTKLLPTWVSDWFWKRFYGVHLVEKQWRQYRQK